MQKPIELKMNSMYTLPVAYRIAEKRDSDLEDLLLFFLSKKVSDTFNEITAFSPKEVEHFKSSEK